MRLFLLFGLLLTGYCATAQSEIRPTGTVRDNVRDSLIIQFGNGYRLAVYAPNKAKLKEITNYDINRMLKELVAQLD